MNVLKLAGTRKTVRKFSKEKPPREDILMALEAAREAPSGMNAQPWMFLVVESEDVKSSIRKLCERAEKKFHERVAGVLGEWLKREGFTHEKPFLEEAPYLIVVLGYSKAPFWIQSVWLAVGYLILALEELGLGSVTYTPPNPEDVERLLDTPEHWRLQTIIPVGYPADPKPKYPRKDLSEIVEFL